MNDMTSEQFAAAEKSFDAYLNSRVREHKLARLNTLRDGCADPDELKAYDWVAKWIAANSPVCGAMLKESFDQKDRRYQQCVITAVIEVSTWCFDNTIHAITNLGPMLGRDLMYVHDILTFAHEYQQTTRYPSPVLAGVVERLTAQHV